MKLLIDAGNSYVKWAWFDGELRGFGEYAHAGATTEEVAMAMTDCDREASDIRIASVAGPDFGADLGRVLSSKLGAMTTHVAVEPKAHGITVAYRYPERLGVDRWLAMIGARAGYEGPICVADAGTALTVDGVLQDGTHIGGLISPGIQMMRAALFDDTAEIAARADAEKTGEIRLFADDTAAAVVSGSVYSAVALIQYAADELDRISDEPATLFLTGGGAGTIAPLLRRECHVLRELVLRGLATIVGSETG